MVPRGVVRRSQPKLNPATGSNEPTEPTLVARPRVSRVRAPTVLVLSMLAGSPAMAVVAVDTGLGHLSAALSTPTISLYGPTDPKRIGTIGYKQIHLQAEQTSAEIDIHPDKIMGLLDILIT